MTVAPVVSTQGLRESVTGNATSLALVSTSLFTTKHPNYNRCVVVCGFMSLGCMITGARFRVYGV